MKIFWVGNPFEAAEHTEAKKKRDYGNLFAGKLAKIANHPQKKKINKDTQICLFPKLAPFLIYKKR